MKRTTIYLPDDLKAELERVAQRERRTEADIIRESLAASLASRPRPKPRVPLGNFSLGDPTVAMRVDEILAEGFGQD
ncbi:MAG: CopG family transcriptional regulator [Sporichthyaceae bacterium]